MKNLEGRLRAGMTANGLDEPTQATIIQNISSFALYGFPEMRVPFIPSNVFRRRLKPKRSIR